MGESPISGEGLLALEHDPKKTEFDATQLNGIQIWQQTAICTSSRHGLIEVGHEVFFVLDAY